MTTFGPPFFTDDQPDSTNSGESLGIRSTKQPTLHPTDKLTGVEHGGVLSLLVVGILMQFGIEPNPYLAAGIGGASAWLVGYMTKERGGDR